MGLWFGEICQFGFTENLNDQAWLGLAQNLFSLAQLSLGNLSLNSSLVTCTYYSFSDQCTQIGQKTDKYHFCALFKFQIPVLNVLYLLHLSLVAVICYAISLNVTFLNTKFIDFAKSDLKFPPFLAIFGLFYHFLAFFH